MANRIEFAVIATPIVSVAQGENVAVDTIAYDMQKSLGGSGSVSSGETSPNVTVNYTITGGYISNVVNYANINTSASTTNIVGDINGGDFAIVRHTGHLYLSPTELGAPTTMALDIYIGTQLVSTLRPGEAMVFPFRGKIMLTALGARLQSGTTGVAIEYFFAG